MQTWDFIELLAWGLSAVFAGYMLLDWIRTDSTYSEAVLLSSQEGELEALTEGQSEA